MERMCWLGVLVVALMVVRRIPRILWAHRPLEGTNPEMYHRWRVYSLTAVTIFLTSWIAVPIGLLIVSQSAAGDIAAGQIRRSTVAWTYGLLAVLLAGIVGSLAVQVVAWRIKSRMQAPSPADGRAEGGPEANLGPLHEDRPQ